MNLMTCHGRCNNLLFPWERWILGRYFLCKSCTCKKYMLMWRFGLFSSKFNPISEFDKIVICISKELKTDADLVCGGFNTESVWFGYRLWIFGMEVEKNRNDLVVLFVLVYVKNSAKVGKSQKLLCDIISLANNSDILS